MYNLNHFVNESLITLTNVNWDRERVIESKEEGRGAGGMAIDREKIVRKE